MPSADLVSTARHIKSLVPPPAFGQGAPPLTLKDECVARILLSLKLGTYRDTAVRAAGISRTTLYNTIARAKQGDPDAVALVEALDEAEADGERWHAENIACHAKKTWVASAWTLERKYPERYGRRDREGQSAQVTVICGGESQVSVSIQSSPPPAELSPADSQMPQVIDVQPLIG